MESTVTQALMPLLICLARIADVTLGTLRTVSVVRGRVALAAVLGFVEVSIWVLAISKVIGDLDNPLNLLGYAGGFALGNAAGILIERRLALGELVLRIMTRKGAEIAARLRELGLRVTELDGRGRDGPVSMLYIMVERVDAAEVERIATSLDPGAFVVVEDLRHANRRLVPATSAGRWRHTFPRK